MPIDFYSDVFGADFLGGGTKQPKIGRPSRDRKKIARARKDAKRTRRR